MKITKSFFWRLFWINVGAGTLVFVVGCSYLYYTYATLPKLITVEDYKPLLSSDIYSRDGEKIGELYSSKQGVRYLTPYQQIPPLLVNAFVAAEDGSFFTHTGFNLYAIARAVWINLTSGQKRQGASTITQQAARTLFLSTEKTWIRKLKEALLTYQMEKNLRKEDIIYLYLNQIYLGQGAYGVAAAAETYYRKKLTDLSLAEMAMLAGVPTSPSRLNPVVAAKRAKERQLYVLGRMESEGYITEEERKKAADETLQIQAKKSYKDTGPYFVETVRQMLVKELGEQVVLEQGLKIHTSLDIKAQAKAIESVRAGLRAIDKRRGFRGPKRVLAIEDTTALETFLAETREKIIREKNVLIQLKPDGTTFTYPPFEEYKKTAKTLTNIPPYIKIGDIVEGAVTKVDDANGIVYVRFAESQGIIPLTEMAWARPMNPDLFPGEHLNIKKPSKAVSVGNILDVRVIGNNFSPVKTKGKTPPTASFANYAHLALEQEPEVQGALLSFDLETGDITAMVGGFDYAKFKFNRSYQAIRQTGSAFKPIVYAAGLEKGLTVGTPIMGAPIVFGSKPMDPAEQQAATDDKESEEPWKPENYDGKFTGDVLMRTALKRSLNTPTIRVMEKATVPYAAQYARRLGIFSPLNMDLSMALGSSGVTLYEMNKALAVVANAGKRFSPILIREVRANDDEVLLKSISLDQRFKEKLDALEQEFQERRQEYQQSLEAYRRRMASREQPTEDDRTPEEKPPTNGFYFNNPDQLISPQTAYLLTNMLQGVAMEADGTGGKAAALGRPVAGKTGTTNGYYDAWFLGYTPNVVASVWVGLDTEKTLGKGETGGDAALPIWLPFMQAVHTNVPVKQFPIPEKIVFLNIDTTTGKPSPTGMRLPFLEGTEPGSSPQTSDEKQIEEKNFLRESF